MTADPAQDRVHGTCVAFEGRGALLVGSSGSGKSGLALDLMAYGASLVADDQVLLTTKEGDLWATAPDAVRGMIEARGAGLVRVRVETRAKLAFVVDLDSETDARLPQPRQFCITDTCLPLIAGKNLPNLGSLVMACLRYGDVPLIRDPDT